MMGVIDNIGPLLRGIGSSSKRNMCPPAWLRKLGSLPKLASEGSQYHAAGSVRDPVVEVCCTVVEEFIDFGAGVFCCSCLRCSYGAESHLKFVVDGSGVVQECTNDALTPFDARFIKRRGSVNVVVCILFVCPIDDFTVLVGRVFRLY